MQPEADERDERDDALGAQLRLALRVLQDAPAAWVQRAEALVPLAAPVGWRDVATAGWRWLEASLRFDSWQQGSFAPGLRSGRGDTRHLLFSVDGRDVDLRLRSGPAGCGIEGQILGPDEQGVVELAHEGSALRRETALDELASFRFDDLPPGRYRLQLRLPEAGVRLPAVTLGEGDAPAP